MLRVRGLYVPVRTLALLLSELLLITLAFYFFVMPIDGHRFALVESFGLPEQFSLVLVVLTMLTMIAVGLYNYDAILDYRAMLARIVVAFALEAPLIFAATLFFREAAWSAVPAWPVFYFKTIFALVVCLVTSRAVFRMVADTGALKRRVVILGAGERALRIQQIADRQRSSQFVPAAFIAAARDGAPLTGCAWTLEDDAEVDRLVDFVRRCGAGEIVVAADDRRGLPVHQLLGCKVRGIGVTEFLTFCERESGRIDLDALQPSWLIFSDGFRMNWAARVVKRCFDIAVSTAMLILTLPLLLLTALLIKLEDGGPILYSQERVGLFGARFILYKFRSMRVDAERGGGPQWAAKKDSRVTRVGAIIRMIRIDELPQLINVLKGDMSFIGPRPERPYFVDQLAPRIPFYAERHAVKPGITGWAQINHPYGASLQDARQKLSYDLYYVKNHTLLLDLIILIQTVRVILFPEGAR